MNRSETIIDTLSRPVEEGLYDPYIFKAVHVAGGPGAGKGFIGSQMFKGLGLKFINSDTPLERISAMFGLDLKKDLGSDVVQQIIRPEAKRIMKAQRALALGEKLGIVFDATGADYGKVERIHRMAGDHGYDNSMVFVNTSLDVALERNRYRSRVVPDDIVKAKWEEVQNNLGRFQRLFGPESTVIVDNNEAVSDHELRRTLGPDLRRAALRLLSKPIRNRLARQWIEAKLAERTGAEPDPKTVDKIMRGRG